MRTDENGQAPMDVDRVAWLEVVAMASRAVLRDPADADSRIVLAKALESLDAGEPSSAS